MVVLRKSDYLRCLFRLVVFSDSKRKILKKVIILINFAKMTSGIRRKKPLITHSYQYEFRMWVVRLYLRKLKGFANNMHLESIIVICVGIISQCLFLIILIRNLVTRKSFVGWLFPGGTTKSERVLMVVSLLAILLTIILAFDIRGY